MNNKSAIVGVDIGGSHITAAMCDLESRAIIEGTCVRQPVDPFGSAEEIIATWSAVIRQACVTGGGTGIKIGIALPGPFDYKRGISLIKNQQKYDALYGLNVKDLLAESLQLDKKKIYLMNDAACFLKGEVFGGAGKGYDRVMGLTLGTGLGSAWFADEISTDADLWNTPFLNGIAEDYLSSRWFIQRFGELTGITLQNVKQLTEMKENTAAVQEVFDGFGKNLAQFLSPYIASEKPGLIVLGGNIARAYPLFAGALSAHLGGGVTVPFHVALLGESAILLGAASAWFEAHDTLPV